MWRIVFTRILFFTVPETFSLHYDNGRAGTATVIAALLSRLAIRRAVLSPFIFLTSRLSAMHLSLVITCCVSSSPL
jgi:hypothetical protein